MLFSCPVVIIAVVRFCLGCSVSFGSVLFVSFSRRFVLLLFLPVFITWAVDVIRLDGWGSVGSRSSSGAFAGRASNDWIGFTRRHSFAAFTAAQAAALPHQVSQCAGHHLFRSVHTEGAFFLFAETHFALPTWPSMPTPTRQFYSFFCCSLAHSSYFIWIYQFFY